MSGISDMGRAIYDKVRPLLGGESMDIKYGLSLEPQVGELCINQVDNPFGRNWDVLEQPVEAIIAAIDTDKLSVGFRKEYCIPGSMSEIYSVGLAARQMRNLGIKGRDAPSDDLDFAILKTLRKHGLQDNDYGGVGIVIGSGDRKEYAGIYNFGGPKSAGCGISVSSNLADVLGLKLGDRIMVSTEYLPRVSPRYHQGFFSEWRTALDMP